MVSEVVIGNKPSAGLFDSCDLFVLGVIFGGHNVNHMLYRGDAFDVVVDLLNIQDDC